MAQYSRPRHVLQWHITHRCNLRCRHCYQEDFTQITPADQLYQILDKYSDFVSQNGFAGQVNLTGGEPLLHPEFFALAREIKGRGFRLGIMTNGTLIDEETAVKIKALKPVFVQVSLDGTGRTHDSIRGKGAFRQALAGIRQLKKQHIRVLVSFTAQKSNWRHLGPLAGICALLRVDKLWWDRVVTDNPADQAELALSTEEFQKLLRLTAGLQKLYRNREGGSMVTSQRALQFLGCAGDTGYICSAGRTLAVVLANGDVMPCRRLPFVIGNIRESSFSEILEGSSLLGEWDAHPFPDSCMACPHLLRCRGGAKCIAYAQTGDCLARDPNCFCGAEAAPWEI